MSLYSKQSPLDRAAGILLPIFSLPGPYGIGTLGSEAHRFVEFLETAGQKLWQVLPGGPTGFGDSPYQSFSAFAGNPYFISPELLQKDGLLTQEEEQSAHRDGASYIDYGDLYQNRLALLRKAAERFDETRADFLAFCAEESWLEDFALFMSLKDAFPGISWHQWPSDIRKREKEALLKWKTKLAKEIRFWKFTQFVFFDQWKKLRLFAAEHQVELIGDLPIYTADDSADVWSEPEQFLLDEELRPEAVAGVPPDYFSATGQRWGNPLYRWEFMAEDGFSWWKRRLSANAKLYDYLRIDHFLGLVRYWAVDRECETAVDGKFYPGPGEDLINALFEANTGCRILAEDLGVPNPKVQKLLEEAGLPGMRVLLFAFGDDAKNPYLPHMHDKNAICYVGTHDNQTLCGWLKDPEQADNIKNAMAYFEITTPALLPAAIRKAALFSVCNTAIISMADWLNLEEEARINTPGSADGNWRWRLEDWQLSSELAIQIRRLTEKAGRI